jgi:hypothetical protein
VTNHVSIHHRRKHKGRVNFRRRICDGFFGSEFEQPQSPLPNCNSLKEMVMRFLNDALIESWIPLLFGGFGGKHRGIGITGGFASHSIR